MTLKDAITKLNRYDIKVTFYPSESSESIHADGPYTDEYFMSYDELIQFAEDLDN